MNQRTSPSYGWWIAQGATTTWEQWNGTGSRNHPMFGGGIVWFYRVLAGMDTDPSKPGYDNIIFKPQPAEDVTFASYSTETTHGLAAIHWVKDTNTFNLDVTVPVGSTATVYVPSMEANNITESSKPIKDERSVRFLRFEDGCAVYAVGSGSYFFLVKH